MLGCEEASAPWKLLGLGLPLPGVCTWVWTPPSIPGTDPVIQDQQPLMFPCSGSSWVGECTLWRDQNAIFRGYKRQH